ncbi:DUF4844 domain-containing protein [Mucilaginibacter celer]|nr:DUF4844 domain-containing protein [Mucilaginibacter celer]
MPDNQSTITKLIAFKERDKFSSSAWEERGLNPSPDDEMSHYLQQFFNDCAAGLADAVENEASPAKLKSLLKRYLGKIKYRDYDTEEGEFICDLFEEMAHIIGVNINDDLNNWLHGRTLNVLWKLKSIFNKTKPAEIQFTSCTGCEVELETHIISKQEGIPDQGWMIVRCNNCNEFNLLSFGKGIRQIQFINYGWIETLPPDKFNHTQALTRLQQVRTYRR